MAVTEPTSASPLMSLLEWDESAVHSWMVHMGLPQYEDAIYEHGITGDVLSVMDHSALGDLGINSLGHRLNLLRAVWELKTEQGIEIGEDEWVPQDVPEVAAQKASEHLDKLWDVVLEQQERLQNLERDQSRLLSTLQERGMDIPMASSMDGEVDRSQGVISRAHKTVMGGAASPRWQDFGSRSEEEPEAGPSRQTTRRASIQFPSSLNSSTATQVPPRSSDSATFKESFTPTTTNGNYPFDSPSNHLTANAQQIGTKLVAQAPPLTRMLSGTAIMPASSPPANVTTYPQSLASSSNSLAASTNTRSNTQPSPNSIPSDPTAAPTTQTSGPSDQDKSKAKDAATNAAKSFRVTLEDPCWKVLPAALKKYKINDDWKMYALFICFGNTERCLSYDEKPLLLFQKLKESGQKPVFMLRHMRDIKSPITVAQQKQLAKLGFPATSTVNVLPKIKPASDTSTSPTKNTSLAPGTGREGGEARGFPELPSPGMNEDGTKMVGTLVDADGRVSKLTYAVSIYPYLADRQDEFDVAVGSTFAILSKAKGWYIVQKDPDGMGKVLPDQSKSGWVPAGCLLELSTPIATSTPPAELNTIYPGLSPLSPTSIMSSSYPGLVLMDYEAKSSDELTLKEGEKVKVYKKYCHWSYTIKQDTGERGWVPAWFIGKIGGSSSSSSMSVTSAPLTSTSNSSLPTTATTEIETPRDHTAQNTAGSIGNTKVNGTSDDSENVRK